MLCFTTVCYSCRCISDLTKALKDAEAELASGFASSAGRMEKENLQVGTSANEVFRSLHAKRAQWKNGLA